MRGRTAGRLFPGLSGVLATIRLAGVGTFLVVGLAFAVGLVVLCVLSGGFRQGRGAGEARP